MGRKPKIMTESMLLDNIDKGVFDIALVGKSVRLNEDDETHDWVITGVNPYSYELCYNDWIDVLVSVLNKDVDDPIIADKVRDTLNQYKSRLSSSIQAKLKPYFNDNSGDDLAVVLSIEKSGYERSMRFNCFSGTFSYDHYIKCNVSPLIRIG